jgi:hypothetical protein
MVGWQGYDKEGCPCWFGTSQQNSYIWASVDPSGLLIVAQLDDLLWQNWLDQFQHRLSTVHSIE